MTTPSQPQPRSVLGKGLASLLPTQAPAGATSNPVATPAESSSTEAAAGATSGAFRQVGISVLPIEQIRPNENQPRREFDDSTLEELAQSIRENGLIQPLIVRKVGDHFELIAGERRLRASKLAGVKMIPVVIRKTTDRESLELAIVENIQREDLNCVDEALAYFQLMQEYELSQDELAKKMGKERATIANALRILKLSESILAELKKGSLSRGHAKALLAVDDPVQRDRLAKEALETGLSVRQIEKRAQEWKEKTSESKQPTKKVESSPQSPVFNQAIQTLTRRYMTKVEIKGDARQGLIQLKYGSPEELNRILNVMMGES